MSLREAEQLSFLPRFPPLFRGREFSTTGHIVQLFEILRYSFLTPGTVEVVLYYHSIGGQEWTRSRQYSLQQELPPPKQREYRRVNYQRRKNN